MPLLLLFDDVITSLFPDIIRQNTTQVLVVLVLALIVIIRLQYTCIQRERRKREDYIYQRSHNFPEKSEQKMLSRIELAATKHKIHQELSAVNQRLEKELNEHREEVEKLRYERKKQSDCIGQMKDKETEYKEHNHRLIAELKEMDDELELKKRSLEEMQKRLEESHHKLELREKSLREMQRKIKEEQRIASETQGMLQQQQKERKREKEEFGIELRQWKEKLKQVSIKYDTDIREIYGRLSGCEKENSACLLYTSPSPRDATLSRMPSSA